MGNQQLYINNKQYQVLLTAVVGDGNLSKTKNENWNSCYSTNCIHRDYIEFKKLLLGNLSFNISKVENNGYKKGILYTLSTKRLPIITTIKNYTLDKILQEIDELGLAIWFYDDGSLHKNKLYAKLYDIVDDVSFIDRTNDIRFVNHSLKHYAERSQYYKNEGWDVKSIKFKI